ncbi:phosphotransferase [Candidatus Wolfebacteria bacterium]|nr:phosphotransferase [Candidatus Wolfebacteria bacterium]
MDSSIIKKFKKEYGFKNPVLLKKLDTRGNRRAFLIADGNDKYVLKSLPYNKELKNRLEFLSKIKKQGVNIPALINTRSNKKYFLFSHNAFFLSEFIDLKENRPSEYFFKNLGGIVGKFHKIKIKNSKIPEVDIKEKIKKLKATFSKKKIDIKIRKEIINFCSSFPSIFGATTGLVHGDISYYNVLGRKKLFLIDLDDVSRGPIVYDLGQMIAFMFNLIPFDFPKLGMKMKQISRPFFLKSGLESFFENYSQEIKLSKKDIEILPKMAMLACAENIYLKPEGIFKWNYKRFEKIEKNQGLIKQLAQKYFKK